MTADAAGATTRLYHHTLPSGETLTITIDDARDARLTDFGKATLRDRYLLPGESFQDMFARVAIANSDEQIRGVMNGHAQRMYDAISKLWFMPATPVLTNSGTERGLPISCFLNRVGDSMDSIADTVYENIWLAAKGGGIGTAWSDVREINHPIAGSITGKTSGIIPFLRWQDAQTEAISQGSLRRGSAATYLHVRHPEIVEFVDIRRHQGGDPRRKAHNIHHGILVPDAFMEMVFKDDPAERRWDLISPKDGSVTDTVDARELYIKIITARLELGEPYIIFIDRVKEHQPEIHKALGLEVVQSNLCSEITLPTGADHLGNWRTAVCCLSSLVMDTGKEWFGDEELIFDVMRFLDNTIQQFIDRTDGMKGFERARYSAIRERSVGLGMMGFHSTLQAMGMPFESIQATNMLARMWGWLATTADKGQDVLVAERGECPDSADARAIDPSIKAKRLTHVFSIAPTASISIVAGGASPCLEPTPANSFTQKTLSGSFNVRNPHLDALLRRRFDELEATVNKATPDMQLLLREQPAFAPLAAESKDQWLEDVWHSITINDGSVQHLPFLSRLEKATFKTAFEIDQRWVIKHHAAIVKFVCQAMSVNVFLPANVHKKDLSDLHKLAWELGLKSLYYLRSRSISKAMAVDNLAGEMPTPQLETAAPGPMYVDEPECAACQ
ncbi:MAG TPA: ribonucleoside-diphosphate reductase subunit alpha [Candidatus Sphingomonas excrementigallinarum]|nr:ribonucleoside-diphosphate reductase subunit alpha [Candidatus Sphingomonas excrementigallinarum]